MPASVSINAVATTPGGSAGATTAPAAGADRFADTLREAASKSPESRANSVADAPSPGPAQAEAGDGGGAASSQAGEQPDAGPDAATPSTNTGEAPANGDPLAGSIVPPWLPLVGAMPGPLPDPTSASETATSSAQPGAAVADPAALTMPAQVLQAIRQLPGAKPAAPTPPADDGRSPSPSLPPAAAASIERKVDATVGAGVAPIMTGAGLDDAIAKNAPQTLSASTEAMPIATARHDFLAALQPPAPHAPGVATPATPSRGSELPGAAVPVPMTHPQWSDAFASRIALQVRDGVQQISLALNPAELGPVDVRLSVTDGQVTAHFHTAHQNVRQAIEDAMPKLREMLSQSGLNLADANVSQQAPRREERANGQPNRWQDPDEAAAESAPISTIAPTSRNLGLIDAYV